MSGIKINNPVDKDFLIELRRNAYVECTENYLKANNVVGIFGDAIPEEIFYACGLIPVPIEGVDSHVFKFGKENEGAGYCDVIKSTLIYLTTQKCPILYSCKMYVVEDTCKNFYNVIKANTQKEIHIYNTEKELIETLCKNYGTIYDEKVKQKAKTELNYIKEILERITYYSDMDTEAIFLLKYYTKYMTDLSMRKKYFTVLNEKIHFQKQKKNIQIVSSLCPRGNFKNICNDINSTNIRLERSWDNSDYGYAKCIFNFDKEENYKN